MRVTIPALIYLLKAALLFAALHFLGDLRTVTFVLLALLFAELFSGRPNRNLRSDTTNFVPHIVSFGPQIGKMLIDLGLIEDPAWKELMASPENSDPWSGDRLSRRGIYGFALFLDSEGSTVVHWPKLATYTDGYAMKIELEFLEFDRGEHAFSEWNPAFIIKPTGKGYGIGLEVKESWWKRNEERLKASGFDKRVDTDHLIGRTSIYFEVLPSEVFWIFGASTSTLKLAQTSAKAALQNLGWKLQDFGDSPEAVTYQWDTFYESPYATVSTNYLISHS